MTQPGGLTLVTVAHAGELPLLVLQARSLARNMRGSDVSAIHVYVNDRNEAEVRNRVRAMVPEYGPLADRVRVMGAAEAFGAAASPATPRGWLYRMVARYPRLQLINRGGWNGNDGWRVQQAFKLAAGRNVDTAMTVFLDTKNILVRPVTADDFVTPDGRARSWFLPHEGRTPQWLANSQQALGLRARPGAQEITCFVTPFAIETALLREILAHLEARRGPVQHFFAFRLNNATEFMLINAYCNAFRGGVRQVFADGLVRSYTVWGDPALLESVLAEAVAEDAACLGLHRQAVRRMAAHHHAIVTRLLTRSGIVANGAELDRILAPMQPQVTSHAA